jgi:hypothetical protein
MAKFRLVLSFIIAVSPFASTLPTDNTTNICRELASKISRDSAVLYQCMYLTVEPELVELIHHNLANINFTADIHHWFTSSSQIPACVLEVGSTKDTSIAV